MNKIIKKLVKDLDENEGISLGSDILSYVEKAIQQAKAEEMEKVEDMRNSLPPYPADKENPMKHMYQNEGYSKALDDILSQG